MFPISPRFCPYDDDFGVLRLADELMEPRYSLLMRPAGDGGRPTQSRSLVGAGRPGESEIHNTDKEFRIRLDLHHYKPEEVKIVSDNHRITINAKHEEKQDNHGYVSREITRIYKLPDDVDSKSTTSTMNSQGVLSIKVAKKAIEPPKEIPIPVDFKDIKDTDYQEFLGDMDSTNGSNNNDNDSEDSFMNSNDNNLSTCAGPRLWKSYWEEDEDDVEEFTEEEMKNDPTKQILWAAEKNKLDIATELLASDSKLVSSRDGDLYTPLHRASYNNHVEMAKLLLSHGADVAARTEDGWQPLHSAARWNSVETAQLLIHSGADVNATTNGHLTPLHMAASEAENGQILELLLTNPFTDISIKSAVGETAQEICERHSPYYKLFYLTENCVNVFDGAS